MAAHVHTSACVIRTPQHPGPLVVCPILLAEQRRKAKATGAQALRFSKYTSEKRERSLARKQAKLANIEAHLKGAALKGRAHAAYAPEHDLGLGR